jgi:hypothetical protein
MGRKKAIRLISLRITCMTPRMIADLPLRSSAAVTYRLFAMEWDLLLPWTYGQGEEEKRIGP